MCLSEVGVSSMNERIFGEASASLFCLNLNPDMRPLLLGIFLFALAQILIWFQTNSQFFSKWAKNNPWVLAIGGGVVISYIFIKATALLAGCYEGQLWPARFISFCTGIFSFAFLTWYVMGEAITMKTAICLILAFGIVCIQVFWR